MQFDVLLDAQSGEVDYYNLKYGLGWLIGLHQLPRERHDNNGTGPVPGDEWLPADLEDQILAKNQLDADLHAFGRVLAAIDAFAYKALHWLPLGQQPLPVAEVKAAEGAIAKPKRWQQRSPDQRARRRLNGTTAREFGGGGSGSTPYSQPRWLLANAKPGKWKEKQAAVAKNATEGAAPTDVSAGLGAATASAMGTCGHVGGPAVGAA